MRAQRAAPGLLEFSRQAPLTSAALVLPRLRSSNKCLFACAFCAFSKGAQATRGDAYAMQADDVTLRAALAAKKGATELCMQGGINPDYDHQTYLSLLRAARRGAPNAHVHAFSPLEVAHGAAAAGTSVADFLRILCKEGLASLPGTAAEILHDDVRRVLCPDKLTSDDWIDVVKAAHGVGLRTTSTIMFGSVEGPTAVARHLRLLRDLQEATGGITEFVPLPFVHMQAPIYLKGASRRGPTLREAVLVHAVSRLALGHVIPHVQCSWTKLGRQGAAVAAWAGVDDLGGTLMSESISRAAGAGHGQEMTVEDMEDLVRQINSMASHCKTRPSRYAWQRTTLYSAVAAAAPGVQDPAAT